MLHHRRFPLGRPPPPTAPLHPGPYKSLHEDPQSIPHLTGPSLELLPLSPFTSTELHHRHSLLFSNNPFLSLHRPVKSSVSSVQPSSSSRTSLGEHVRPTSPHHRKEITVAGLAPSLCRPTPTMGRFPSPPFSSRIPRDESPSPASLASLCAGERFVRPHGRSMVNHLELRSMAYRLGSQVSNAKIILNPGKLRILHFTPCCLRKLQSSPHVGMNQKLSLAIFTI
jgi:hypothetical protein